MQIIKGKRNGKRIEIEEVPMSAMTLLPPRPGVCQECAVDHDRAMPHNPQSLYYQTKFQMEHGRPATWEDAMAHCSDGMKAAWVQALQKLGIEIKGIKKDGLESRA